MKPRIRVLLPLPLADAYDYRVPEGLAPVPGSFVSVPLGGRETIGAPVTGYPVIAAPVAGGSWVRDACEPMTASESCAVMSDRRYAISRRYAQALPSMMPSVRKHHATVVHGRDQRAQVASRRPPRSAAMANANTTEKPT